MMAVAIVFSACKKDEDDDDEPRKRLVKVEITSSKYNQTDTYTYNANNQVSVHQYSYVSEYSNTQKTTTYTYNAAGEPSQWEQTGTDSYGNGEYTTVISNSSIVVTKPSGTETTYTLDASRRITHSDDGSWEYNYFYIGDNLDRTEGLLSVKQSYDLTKSNVMPALGVSHWTPSKNLPHKGWIYNGSDQSDMSLLTEYTYQFNADGTPATAVMYNGFYPDVDFYVTYTYEEY